MPGFVRRITQALAVAGMTAGVVAVAGSPAHAQPAGFPDLDTFSPAPVDDYSRPAPRGPDAG